jgi:NADH:ubiquinone reductase (H+-translocating)
LVTKQRVVVVGGGFAGVKVAQGLAGSPHHQVTLISDHPDFRYYPSLYRTATGGRRVLVSMPLTELFERQKNITILQDRVTGLDRGTKSVTTQAGKTIAYDTLVLALGVQTNYFGIKGLPEYSYGIKTLQDAERLKRHLHDQLISDKQPDLNYVIIGGGPTGIELAGALSEYMHAMATKHRLRRKKAHIDLIEAAPRILPRMPKDVARAVTKQLHRMGIKLYTNTAVQAQTADMLMVNNKKIKSHTVIWTAGVTNHPFFKEHDFQLGTAGKVRVNQYLQAEANIYVVGDNADTPYSGMAQTALHDGKYLAENLVLEAEGREPKPYKAKKPVYVIPVGHNWSAVLWGQVRIYGWLGSVLRRLADLIGYHDYEPWYSAGTRWLAEDDEEDLCPICGVN